MSAPAPVGSLPAPTEFTLADADRKNLLDAKDGLLDRGLVEHVERLIARVIETERRDAARTAWNQGRDAFANSLLRPLGENGMRSIEPNPYDDADGDDAS